YQVEEPAPGSHRIRAKVEDFSPSTNSQVLAINDDESKPSKLSRLGGAFVISTIGARLRSQPILADLDHVNLRGFAIQSISPLDPSGWVRVTLARAQTVADPVQTNPVAAEAVQVPAATVLAPGGPVAVVQ